MVSNIIVIGCAIIMGGAIVWAVISEFTGKDDDKKDDGEDSKNE